jgi:hypothetical protein
MFGRVFENQKDLPHQSMIYTEFGENDKLSRLTEERTQEAIMNLMNNGFVLSNFTGWDIDTSADE